MSQSTLLNQQYWEDRAILTIEAGEKSAFRMLVNSKNIYSDAAREIQKETEAFYARYADSNELTLSDVRKRLDKSQLAAAQEDIQRYYSEVRRVGGFGKGHDDYLRGLSARAYMSRLEELKMQMENTVQNLYREINKSFTDSLSDAWEDSYYQSNFTIQKGLGFFTPFTKPNTRMIETAVKQKWLGENYSDRLWNHKEQLTNSLNTTFLRGVALGWNSNKIGRAMANDVMTKYDRSTVGNCVRLARTEFSKIANDATLDGYKEYGVVKQYKYLATLDIRTSEICGNLDGEVFDIEDAKAGLNYPPMHPNCRSTTIAYFPDDEAAALFDKATRAARDPITGKLYYIPAGTNYKQWRESFTDDGEKHFVKAQKMNKQYSSDKKQYKEYKNAIGSSNMPKSFDKFRDLKYNNNDEWSALKDYKASVTHGDLSPLVSFKDYTGVKAVFDNKLVGMETSDGIIIGGYKSHFVDRYFGSVEQRRSGVELDDIVNALLSDKNPSSRISINGYKSQKYKGANAIVTINPNTGNLIQTNPRKGAK